MSDWLQAQNGLLYAKTTGKLRGYRNPVTGDDDPGFPSCIPMLVNSNMIISSRNCNQFDGAILEFTGAFTITLNAFDSLGFGFSVIPPAAGNATIASGDATMLLNGATAAVTRAASNQVFALVQRASNVRSYIVTGA